MPAGSSQLRPVAGVWRHLKQDVSLSSPCTPLLRGWPSPVGTTKHPSRQLMPVLLIFIKVHWGARVREKREKSERSLQSQGAMSTNCLKHHSLTFFPQVWKIPWGRLPYCMDLFIKGKFFYCTYPLIATLLQVPGESIKESKNKKKGKM